MISLTNIKNLTNYLGSKLSSRAKFATVLLLLFFNAVAYAAPTLCSLYTKHQTQKQSRLKKQEGFKDNIVDVADGCRLEGRQLNIMATEVDHVIRKRHPKKYSARVLSTLPPSPQIRRILGKAFLTRQTHLYNLYSLNREKLQLDLNEAIKNKLFSKRKLQRLQQVNTRYNNWLINTSGAVKFPDKMFVTWKHRVLTAVK
jgi:hypothetical protein